MLSQLTVHHWTFVVILWLILPLLWPLMLINIGLLYCNYIHSQLSRRHISKSSSLAPHKMFFCLRFRNIFWNWKYFYSRQISGVYDYYVKIQDWWDRNRYLGGINWCTINRKYSNKNMAFKSKSILVEWICKLNHKLRSFISFVKYLFILVLFHGNY